MGNFLNELRIQVGEPVSYQNKNFLIKQLTGGFKTVILQDPITEKLINVEIKYLLPPIEDSISDNIKRKTIENFDDNEWETAQKRLAVIRPLIENKGNGELAREIAQENKISLATLYRWIKNFENTGQITSLVPEKSDGGRGKGRLLPEVDAIISNAIEEIYLTKQKNPLKKVCREIVRRCRLVDLPPPHINTVRNRILSVSEETQLKFRQGKKAANDKFKPVLKKFPNADYPLAVVQIDHTLLDIILVDDVYRKALGRPWITLAMDIYSRVVTGFYISFDPPGALGTGMCIANSILPKETWLNRLDIEGEWSCWGRMNTIHADNAKEFRGHMLTRACEQYNINLEWRPVKTPNWGGHIERLLGTFLKEIHTLPGTTFSNTKQRGEYNSEAKAAFTLVDFEKWLLHFIVNIYHKRIHTAIGIPPYTKFQEGIYQKTGLPARIFNETQVKLDFLPFVERTIQEYGVIIDYIHYYADVMRGWIHAVEKTTVKHQVKRKFIFKRDPRDISVIFFYDPELMEYFQIPYRDTSRPAMTLWEHKEILNRLSKSGVTQIDEDVIFNAYEKLRELEEQAVTKTKKINRIKKNAKTYNSFQRSIIKEIVNDADDSSKKIEAVRNKIDLTTIKPFDELEYEPLN